MGKKSGSKSTTKLNLLASIVIQSRKHTRDHQSESHRHACPSLLYITSGAGYCIVDQHQYELEPDTVILIPQGCEHELRDNKRNPMIVFVVYFNQADVPVPAELIDDLFSTAKVITLQRQLARTFRNALRKMLHEQDSQPVYYELSMQNQFTELLLNLKRYGLEKEYHDRDHKPDSTERVQGVLNHIRSHYYQPQSLPESAEMARLSERQFASLCRQLTDMTFVNYVNSIRLQKARTLLEQTEMPVSAIAFEVGFEDVSTFYRAFRKHFNCTPLSMRK